MRILLLTGCIWLTGCSFILCGDRGIDKFTIHGVKCTGDVLCNNKWVSPENCKDKVYNDNENNFNKLK